nr:ribonuclease H-like domain-containing protein [Tanacetum cinerariifolium]
FQKLISQLKLNGEVISQEDANMKLLRSLPPAWNNIALVMRNKPDIKTLSMDDLYNNIKVYEAEIKRQSSSGSNSHNVAFVSFENTSSINETVTGAHDIPAAGSKEQPSASSYADDKMEAQPKITQNISSLKLPVLKTRDYDLRSIRMEQYLTHTYYALWKVIINGDSPVPEPPAVGTVVPPKTKTQKLARKNELKAKSTLLLAIPDEHLLKF